jgi:hypothetical protein
MSLRRGCEYRAVSVGLLWRAISAAPRANAQPPVNQPSAILAAQWVPVRETTCVNLAGYFAAHPAAHQDGGYWTPNDVQHADQQVTKP